MTTPFTFALLIISTIHISPTISSNAVELFVGKNGTHLFVNDYGCRNWTNPCGSLLSASWSMSVLNFSLIKEATIHIIDGQNEADITYWNNIANFPFNPCLPFRFYEIEKVNIIFNTTTIKNFKDWFPQSCHKSIYNDFMFYSDHKLIINNLIINDFSTTNLIIIGIWTRNGYGRCINCKFNNITSTFLFTTERVTNPTGSTFEVYYEYGSLFLSLSDINFVDCQFTDIETNGNVFYEMASDSLTFHHRRFELQRTSFKNVIVGLSLFNLSGSQNNILYGAELIVNASEFHNVMTYRMIYDGFYGADVFILNSIINTMSTFGTIYYSDHEEISNIYINNVTILADDIMINNEAFFVFNSVDLAEINNTDIFYSYDTKHTCQYRQGQILKSNVINKWCTVMICEPPTAFINNNGQVKMKNINIDIMISDNLISCTNNCDKYDYFKKNCTKFRFANDQGLIDEEIKGFIQNRNQMEITDTIFKGSVDYVLIYNEHQLIINNVSFNSVNDIHFNPNVLQSSVAIIQISTVGSQTSLVVKNSHFIGFEWQIRSTDGTLEITETTLENSNQALDLINGDHIVINDCKIQNNGEFNGAVKHGDVDRVIEVEDSNDIVITNNNISGYNKRGFVRLRSSSDIYMFGNTFNINAENLFYNISAQNIGFYRTCGFQLWWCSNVEIIANQFNENNINTSFPWIYSSNSTLCMTGNVFSNYAFYVRHTSITSCSQPTLINSVTSNVFQTYGFIDESLFDLSQRFIIDDQAKIPAIFRLDGSNVVMDNVNFTVVNKKQENDAHRIFVSMVDSNLLLVDSYIDKYDLSYNSDICYVVQNERLKNINGYIVRLLIRCDYNSLMTTLNQTMESSVTKLMEHLSPTKINFTTKSQLYYPGQLLQFEYHVTDRMGNIVPADTLNMSIKLERNTFLAILKIEENDCPLCQNALFLYDVSMDNIGDHYDIKVSMEPNILISEYDTLHITIQACPTSQQPDLNQFVCQICNTNYYNLSPNNTRSCKSCEPDVNEGITCLQGHVNISYNYWMSIDGDTGSILSALCLPDYCCSKQTSCSYIYDTTSILCANNRNSTAMLCSSCVTGYSESLNSSGCVKCDVALNAMVLLYPMLPMAIFWSLFLLLTSSDKIKRKVEYTNSINKYLTNPQFVMMLKILFARNTIYYEQALSQVISSNSFDILLKTFSKIFNLSLVSYGGNVNNAKCFIDALNGKGKILVDLLMPAMVLFLVIIYHLISIALKKFNCYTKGPVIILKKRKLNFNKCYVCAFILIIGNILTVLFRLMHCQKVGSFIVHYYFDEHCYQMTWILSLISLLLIIGIFCMIFIKIKKMGHAQRANEENTWNTLIEKFSPQCYWWENVLFIRRICIALFSISVNDPASQVVFIFIIFIFIGLQKKYEPFIIHAANQTECWLLRSLIIVIVMESLHSLNPTFKNVVTSCLILLPFCFIQYYIYLFVKHKNKEYEDIISLSLLKQRIKYLYFCIILYYLPIKNIYTSDVQIVYEKDVETKTTEKKVDEIELAKTKTIDEDDAEDSSSIDSSSVNESEKW
eukprot:403555_1